ncbi:MAG: hypothetical protein B6D68_01840 [spirochete symbiont of Stewartia floridana]|nr:MAG: hypothetical protein B6D68_01840 [spirochete symbiont of Stewartia floridana]
MLVTARIMKIRDELSAPLAIIFDLDGTLADTLADLSDAMNRALHFYGFPEADEDDYRQRIGLGIRNLVLRSLPEDASSSTVDAVIRAFQAIYFTEPVRQTRLYVGIDDLVADLARTNVPMFVHTNKPHAVSETIILQLFHGNPFRRVLGQREDIARKPSAEGVELLLGESGTAPSACWYIGDSEVDVETARASGCAAIAATWGFRSADTLIAAGAEILFHTVDELRQSLL